MLICPHSGLGNQIGNYVFAQYLIFCGIDVKFLFLEDENIDRAFVLNKFTTNLPEASREDIEKFLSANAAFSLYPKFFKNAFFERRKEYFNSLYKVLTRIRQKYGIYPRKTPKFMAKVVSYRDILKDISDRKNALKDVALCDCYVPIKEFQNQKFKEEIRKHFVLKEELDKENFAVFKEIRACENSVGVHIRRGDYIGLKIPVVRKEFILEKIQILAGKFPDVKFFIFSDDIKWAKENLCPNTADLRFVDINDEAKGYLDFVLLNNCRHRIYSASSFSTWLEYLNPNNNSIKFYPEKKDLVVE